MAYLHQPLPPDPLPPAISSRNSKRVPVPFILSSFPAPPSHIPVCNPPPTGPPTDPLPPLPSGPSRISEHDQLFILSSVRSRRSSNYSQKDRDSIVSSRSPSSLGRSLSRSDSLSTTTPHHSRIPPPLSDISDSDTEPVISTTSPVLPLISPRRLLPSHQHNDSISSIDMRHVLGVYPDDRLPSPRHKQHNSADSVHPDTLLSALDLDPIPPTTNRPFYSPPPLSPSRRSNYPLHSPHRSLSGSYRPSHARSSSTVTAVPPPQSQTQHSPIQSHKHSLSDLGGIVVTKTTATTTTPSITSEGKSQERGRDHMTLDELSSNKQNYPSTTPPSSPRVPSPDIATILSVMPRPALSLSRSRSGADAEPKPSRSKSRVSSGQRRVVSTNVNTKYSDFHLPNLNRTHSESALTSNKAAHSKTPSSELAYLHKHMDSNATKPTTVKKSLSRSTSSTTTRSSCYDQDVEDSGYYDDPLERVLEGEGSEDEGVGVGTAVKSSRRGRRSQGNVVQDGGEERGGDSDSSLDLHTPLPHLMLRHGLLSPHSKLLPQVDSRAATPLDGRPGSIMSVVSNGSVMTKSGLIKDERDTVTRRVRHRDGKLLRGGIGLTTGLGWSDSEDEDAPSPLTRRLSSLNLSRRSSASSIQSTSTPPLTTSSSFRRIHPLSRSYSSGAILETEREHDESFDEHSPYLYDYDEDEEEEEEEDHTIEETGNWAQRYRLGHHPTSPPPVSSSWQQRHQHHRQPPPPSTTRSRTRKNHQIQTTTSNYSRTSTGSVGSGFSLEVTIPEGGEERSKTPSRLRRPSFKSSSIGVIENGGGGGRDSSGSSSLDSRFSSGFSSQQDSSSHSNNTNNNGANGNTPSSTSSTLSIPMPSTPKDIFNPASPPMMSSTRGMMVLNKEKSLPPLPAGGLKKKSSGNLQRSIVSNSSVRNSVTTTSTTTTTTTTSSNNTLVGTGKYAFPSSSRIRTFSSTSMSTPPLPTSSSTSTSPTIPFASGGGVLTPSSSTVTIKPNVRPLQLPRQSSITGGTTNRGDRPAVPVPSPTLHSPTLHSPTLRSPHSPLVATTTTTTTNNSLRAPTASLSTLQQRHRPSPITPILLGHSGTLSAPASPAIINSGATTPTSAGSMRPKPRTGTGMVYRTSSYGVGGGGGSKMRAPMILSGSTSLVSGGGNGGGGGGGGGSGSTTTTSIVVGGGGSNSFSGPIAL